MWCKYIHMYMHTLLMKISGIIKEDWGLLMVFQKKNRDTNRHVIFNQL
jgi:hypothetical protein